MNAYLFEPFLTQYYLLEAICGNFMTEKAKTKMFFELAKVFCIAEREELKAYLEDSRLPHYSEIKTISAYERLCRTIEFAQKSGQNIDLTERDRIILAQKREAMTIQAEIFRQVKNLTKEMVSATLLTVAMNGSIDAMTTLAYMEYHGICVCKDTHNAIKRLRLCAKWNNLFGNLMGIAYDGENRKAYFDTLYTVLRNASQQQVFAHICLSHSYEELCKKNQVVRIVEKAFGLGIVRRNLFDQVFAKVAFSEMLSVEDKEKLLLNKQRDAIVSLSDLPFDVSWERQITFDENCAEGIPLLREGEIKKIMQSLAVAKDCPAEVCAPLLIVASDGYITDMYRQMLMKGLSASAVVEIDAGTLSERDFAEGRENAFLRGISKTKAARTVFLLNHCEQLDERQLDELCKMLDYEYRKHFKLFQPPVSLDLSGLVFVLFAAESGMQARRLAECCDTVWTEQISTSEKTTVVESVFRSRMRSFGCKPLTVETGCSEFLSGYDTRQVQSIVDGALRSAIYEKAECITLHKLRAICREQNIVAPKHGFGYT